MFVDKLGLHCFMLTGHEIFYNYFKSDRILPLPVQVPGASQLGFRSIDILRFDDADPNFFELLIGTDQGHILHGVFQVQDNGMIDVVQQFKIAIQTPEYTEIKDIRMTRIKEAYLVLAVSDTKLYQFAGISSLEETLDKYTKDYTLIQKHAIVISAKSQQKAADKKYGGYGTTPDPSSQQAQASDPIKLQFFYSNGLVQGFGWLHDTIFCYGSYSCDMVNDSTKKIANELVLKSQQVEQIDYLRKEGDQPVEGELPTGFANTSFHIVFMYPTNITVVSKFSREIVYS